MEGKAWVFDFPLWINWTCRDSKENTCLKEYKRKNIFFFTWLFLISQNCLKYHPFSKRIIHTSAQLRTSPHVVIRENILGIPLWVQKNLKHFSFHWEQCKPPQLRNVQHSLAWAKIFFKCILGQTLLNSLTQNSLCALFGILCVQN